MKRSPRRKSFAKTKTKSQKLQGGRRTEEEKLAKKCAGQEDLFTGDEIDPEYAIRILDTRTNPHTYRCFNVMHLVEWFRTNGTYTNPYTNLPFSTPELTKIYRKINKIDPKASELDFAIVSGNLSEVKRLVFKQNANPTQYNIITAFETQCDLSGMHYMPRCSYDMLYFLVYFVFHSPKTRKDKFDDLQRYADSSELFYNLCYSGDQMEKSDKLISMLLEKIRPKSDLFLFDILTMKHSAYSLYKLLQEGVNPNLQGYNSYMDTPLQFIINNQNLKLDVDKDICIHDLIKWGADPRVKNLSNESAFDSLDRSNLKSEQKAELFELFYKAVERFV